MAACGLQWRCTHFRAALAQSQLRRIVCKWGGAHCAESEAPWGGVEGAFAASQRLANVRVTPHGAIKDCERLAGRPVVVQVWGGGWWGLTCCAVEARLARRLPQLPVLAPRQLQTHSLYEFYMNQSPARRLAAEGGCCPDVPTAQLPARWNLHFKLTHTCSDAIMQWPTVRCQSNFKLTDWVSSVCIFPSKSKKAPQSTLSPAATAPRCS